MCDFFYIYRLDCHNVGLSDCSVLSGRLVSAAAADLQATSGILPLYTADRALSDRGVVRHSLRFLTVSSSNL